MHHMTTPNPEIIRVTVPVRPEVLEAFKRLAAAGNTSTGKAMGEWLADTLEGVEFMAMKMEEARALVAQGIDPSEAPMHWVSLTRQGRLSNVYARKV